jgi:hypothetical protein
MVSILSPFGTITNENKTAVKKTMEDNFFKVVPLQ